MYGDVYGADQIIGKTLYAKQDVPIYRDPRDDAKPVYTAKKNTPMGIVDTWLAPQPGKRKNLWWGFMDSKGKPFYAEHLEGRYDVDNLKDQGALTVKEAIKQKAKENESTKDFVERLFKYALVAGGVYVIGKALVGKIKF